MMNVIAENMKMGAASTCAGGGDCLCKECLRRRKLAMLGFTTDSVAQYIEEKDAEAMRQGL